jgi:hypothetical protein
MTPTPPDELHQKLNLETARITWPELERHFARGAVVVVAPGLDLVEVAAAVARDDPAAVGAWAQTGAVVRASDDHARRWVAAGEDAWFWAVVVAPWVLVQEISGD